MSSYAVLTLALWLGAGAFAAVALVSLQAGAAPTWAILRGLGAFAALVLLGLIAESVARQGLQQAPPLGPGESGGVETSATAASGGSVAPERETVVLEPEVLTAGTAEESSDAGQRS